MANSRKSSAHSLSPRDNPAEHTFMRHMYRFFESPEEDEMIFQAYYYDIIIRQVRFSIVLVSLELFFGGLYFYIGTDRVTQTDFICIIVVIMSALLSLGLSYVSFFRYVWRAFLLLYGVVIMITAVFFIRDLSTLVQLTMLGFITVCLVGGFPFFMSLIYVVMLSVGFEVIALRIHVSTASLLISDLFVLLFAGFLLYASWMREKGIRIKFDTLETVKRQRMKSDSIIQHMLPPFVVQKLKMKHDSVIIDHFDSVTVMFCEIVNFNALLEKMPAHEVVQVLNDVYTAFDRLTDVHGVNKVEHIGNVYVISAGCPEVTPYHSGRVAEMGLKMLSVVRHFKKVEIRLGIHTGAVMAGVIGFKKLSYHLFGDTINTASRMCSHGSKQRIHVSEATFSLLQNKYTFEARGEIAVKGKGPMRTFFLEGRKSAQGSMSALEKEAILRPLTLPRVNLMLSGGSFADDFGPRATPSMGYTAQRPPNMLLDYQQGIIHQNPPARIFFFLGSPVLTRVQSIDLNWTKGEEEKDKYSKNMFTLRFMGDPSTEEEFIIHNNETRHRRMVLSMVFVLSLVALAGIVDYHNKVHDKTPFYVARYLFIGFGLVCVGLACKFREQVEKIACVILFLCFLSVLVFAARGSPHKQIPFSAPVQFVYLSSMAFSVSGITFVNSSIMNVMAAVAFELLQIWQPTGTPTMLSFSFFVFFGVLMNMSYCYLQEIYERDNWVHELILDDEVEKTDALLTGLLPVNVLMQLKQGRQLIADEFEQVTIMLTDIVGFTEIASRVTPSQLVEFLNILYSIFDKLAEKYGVLKIATIGDAYLCLAGCPEKVPDHAEKVADMALEMLEKVKYLIAPDGTPVRVRVGIHSGPVIAGVVGIKMIHYQIWGDSVQIAGKMESSGKASHIHVSNTTQSLLAGIFHFEPAGAVHVKNVDTATYFLKGRAAPSTPSTPLSPGATPRRLELSTSMIFQNASSWKRRPSSPPVALAGDLPTSHLHRVTSAARARIPRTPRRTDILSLAPLTHRPRGRSVLVPVSSQKEVDYGGPSDILDNLLGLNVHDVTEVSMPSPQSDVINTDVLSARVLGAGIVDDTSFIPSPLVIPPEQPILDRTEIQIVREYETGQSQEMYMTKDDEAMIGGITAGVLDEGDVKRKHSILYNSNDGVESDRLKALKASLRITSLVVGPSPVPTPIPSPPSHTSLLLEPEPSLESMPSLPAISLSTISPPLPPPPLIRSLHMGARRNTTSSLTPPTPSSPSSTPLPFFSTPSSPHELVSADEIMHTTPSPPLRSNLRNSYKAPGAT